MFIANVNTVRANHSGLFPCSLKDLFYHMSGCGLALGSGHTNDSQLMGRSSKPRSGKDCKSFPCAFHQKHRHALRHIYLALHNQHLHPCFYYLRYKIVGVGSGSLHTHKHSPFRCLARIIYHLIDLYIQAALKQRIRESLQPILYYHSIKILSALF